MPDEKKPIETESDNYGMPPNWVAVDASPIIPGAPAGGTPPTSSGANPYGSGVLPSNLGYQPALVKTGYPPTAGPIDLMPIAGGAAVNAKTNSQLKPVSDQASAAAIAAASASTTASSASSAASSASTAAASAQTTANTANTTVNTLNVIPISTIAAAGDVDPSNNYFAMKGTVPPVAATPFKMLTTANSVVISSSPSASFARADGTTTILGQTSRTVTGLPVSSFAAFPYFRESDSTLQFVQASDISIPNITGATFSSGSAQYIETTTTGSCPTIFTVEMWITGTVGGGLFDFSAPQVVGVGTASVVQCFVNSGGEVSFNTQTGGVWSNAITVGANVLDSTWHHILVSYTNAGAGTAEIFVDGCNTSDGITLWQNLAMGGLANTTGSWHWCMCQGLAGAPKTGNVGANGTVSYIALYSAALGAAESGAHLNAYASLSEAYYVSETVYNSAVNLWKLNETSGTTAADSVGSNTGTYKNSPTLNQTSPVLTVSGSPAICFPYNAITPLQVQSLQGNVPLSAGGITFSTLAAHRGGSSGGSGFSGGGSSGGASGTGSGGISRGGGACFSGDTLIRTNRGDVRIDEIQIGDRCFTAAGNWLVVDALLSHVAEPRKLHIMPNRELITFSHKILRGGKWVNAGTVFAEIADVNVPVYTLTMRSDEPLSDILSSRTERSFQLSNGIFAHNSVILKS